MPTFNALDAADQPIALEKPNDNGREAASGSRPVVLSTEDLAAINAITAALATLAGHVDGLEGFSDGVEALIGSSNTKLDTLATHVDGLEALLAATNAALATLTGNVDGLEGSATALNGYADGLEALIGSTNAALTTLAGHVDGLEGFTDGVETLIGSTNTALTTLAGHVDGLEALLTATNAALALVGTRGYSAGAARLAYAGASAQSAAIAASEVMLHNCGTARCYVAAGANPAATVNDIPLEAGEKFHLRITSGHKIAALQDSAAGNLNLVPVV